MRRIMLMLTVGDLIVTMVATSAVPAHAIPPIIIEDPIIGFEPPRC